MKPISNEKKELIVEAKLRGESDKKIMEWAKNNSRSSISKIWRLFQKTGSYFPKAYTGNNVKITAEMEEKIKAVIKNKPDITLLDLIDELSLNVSESGLSRCLKRMGLTYKKRLYIQMDKNVRM